MRCLTILISILLGLNVVLGVGSDSVVICFGHDADHHHAEAAHANAHQQVGCREDHTHLGTTSYSECCCADLSLRPIDIPDFVRLDVEPIFALTACGSVCISVMSESDSGPSAWPAGFADDPGGGVRLICVRSTRLLL